MNVELWVQYAKVPSQLQTASLVFFNSGARSVRAVPRTVIRLSEINPNQTAHLVIAFRTR